MQHPHAADHSLASQCLRSSFLLACFASKPHPERRNWQMPPSEVASRWPPHVSPFPFPYARWPLSSSCLGNPEPPLCFPHPGRLLRGPTPRGRCRLKASPFCIGSWPQSSGCRGYSPVLSNNGAIFLPCILFHLCSLLQEC